MLKNQAITPEGTTDYLFEEAAARRRTEAGLRRVFEAHGFCEVVTPGLEFLDVFSAGGRSLPTEEMYQLTDHKGRPMVLRPDSTLPIARLFSTRLKQAERPVRLYYTQPVYTASRGRNGRSDEVLQAGVELLGSTGRDSDLEILTVAAEAMRACGEKNTRLELGHIGLFNALVDAMQLDASVREEIRLSIEGKNDPALNDLLDRMGGRAEADVIRRLPRLFGGEEVFGEAQALLSQTAVLRENRAAAEAIGYLRELYRGLCERGLGEMVTVDLGLVNRADYYTGIVFKGYLEGYGEEVLSGGRYDTLLPRFGVEAGAVGFGVNVDAAAHDLLQREHGASQPRTDTRRPIRVALTKGRLEKSTVELFEKLGFDCTELHEKGRRLVLSVPDANLEVVLAKAADVITYIENGVCDIGVVGRDTILEYGGSFFEVADLGIGKCRFALAARKGTDFYSGYSEKTIATKYPNVARAFFEKKGMDVRIVKIEGSVELAPLLGLADAIVDIVETGSTLRENGLAVVEDVAPVSARLIVNTVSLKLYKAEIESLIGQMERAVRL